MTHPRVVHFVVPEGVDDPARASGGNVFDVHVRDGLRALGWDVRVVQGRADAAASALRSIGDGGLVLIDGLVARQAAGAVEAESARLRIVVLAHMVSAAFPGAAPDDVEGERRALAASAGVVTTSAWTRRRLAEAGIDDSSVVIAPPGSDEASAAEGTPEGAALLCVGVVAAHKGQDVLVDALARLGAGSPWSCTIAGALDVEPAFADAVEARARTAGIRDRVEFPGVLSGPALEDAYRRADLVVAPSLVESYGMVVGDALRRGIPVVASDVGGIPEAVGSSTAVTLVPPGDAAALGAALGRWMADPALRARLTARAREERLRVPGWQETAARIAGILEEVR